MFYEPDGLPGLGTEYGAHVLLFVLLQSRIKRAYLPATNRGLPSAGIACIENFTEHQSLANSNVTTGKSFNLKKTSNVSTVSMSTTALSNRAEFGALIEFSPQT